MSIISLGTYRRSTQYRHQGEVAATKEEQTVGSTTTTVLRKYGYDNAGRQTQILQGVNGGTLALLETDTWDGTGRQATRVLGTGNQTLNYAWDIRDRLTGINDPASLGTDKFAVSYTYETGAPAQYGGNISGATWKHAGGTAQTYAYSYDTYGRLTSGTHSGGNSETIAYDANGNITSLTRTGVRAETLAYTYTSGTNRLGTLKSNGSSKSFQYNADGTMKTDGLRGLGAKVYLEKIPISSQTFAMAEEIDMDVVTAAMNGGDDYKFLFVIPLGQHETFRKEFHDFEVIGHLAQPDVGPVLVTPEGAELPIHAQGY